MKLLFTSFFLTISSLLFGQSQLRSVTITDRNDQQRSGFIRYYDWDEQPKFIEFSADSVGEMQPLALRRIQKLVIHDGPVFESLYLKVPYYAKDPLRPGESAVNRIDSTYYLSELLLDSYAVKLYSFIDTDKLVRFVVMKHDSVVMLENIHVKLFKNGLIYNYDEPAFRKTLKNVLYECPTLNTDQTAYSDKGLIDVLKEYLSFCRIESKILLEQKKIDKAILGIGGFGAFGGSGSRPTAEYGVSVQVLLPHQFHNLFAMINVGSIRQTTESNERISDLFIGLYGGRYFGRRALQGRLYTGLSTLGLLDTGLGVSYRKFISADIRYALLSDVLKELYATNLTASPMLVISANFPLGRAANR